METADLLIVNKADGELLTAAASTAAELAMVLQGVRPRWRACAQKVLACSSVTEDGVAQVRLVARMHDAA